MNEALHWGVTSSSAPPLRVALSAAPPLLADSLRSLLDGLADVTILLGEASETGEAAYDIAIVTPDAPAIPADVTIVLDDSSEARGGGALVTSDGTPPGRLDDLASVLAFVQQRGTTAGSADLKTSPER